MTEETEKRFIGDRRTFIPEEIKKRFADLACQLSPENLACDGECTVRQVWERRANIMVQWRVLEKNLGRSIPLSEAWSF